MHDKMLRCFCWTLLILMNGSGASAENKIQPEVEESWQTIWNSGQRIGYAHSTEQRRTVDGREVVFTDTLVSMTMRRFGQSLTIRQKLHHEELVDGTLLKVTSVLENPPNSRTSLVGIVDRDEIKLTSRVAGNETVKTLSGMQGVRSGVYQERLIEAGKLTKDEPVQLEVFEPQLGVKTSVKIEYLGEVKNGTNKGLREVKMKQSLPGAGEIETNIFCNEDWSIQKAVSPLLNMEMRTATADEALEPIGDQEFDFAIDTMVKVDGLKNVDSAKSVTYHVQVEGASPADIFAETHSQSIRKLVENEIELTVTALDLPSIDSSQQDASATGEEYLQSSQLVETSSEIIQQLAEQGSEQGNSVEVATTLEKFVKGYVSDKNFSTAMASAAEVAKSKAGDCTEHAVLFAALLRAKEIPSRVAIGFVYSPRHSAFVGHMWTEAWLNGKWIPLDATRGRAKTGAGYLTISTSSLSDQGIAPAAEFLPMLHLLGRTKIDVVEVIR